MAGKNAFGTKLYRSDGNGEWDQLSNATSIDLPSLSREDIDVTDHDSPDGYMEFIPGLRDGGEVSVDCNYRPSRHDDWVMEDFEDDEVHRYRIVLPTAERHAWTFDAFVTGYEPSAPHDDKLETSITFKVSGKPDLSELGPGEGPGNGEDDNGNGGGDDGESGDDQ